MRVATRPEWPAVVGSRCSMATTEACTNPSKSRSISSFRSAFSIADAAGPASAPSSSSSSAVKAPSRRFSAWSTPTTSPFVFRIGTARMFRVR